MPPKSLAERVEALEKQLEQALARLAALEVKRPPPKTEPRPTREQMVFFCESMGLPASDGEILFDKWTGAGWRTAGGLIKDWQATIRSWKGLNYLPSQKTTANQSYGRARAHSHAPTGDLNSNANRYGRKGS